MDRADVEGKVGRTHSSGRRGGGGRSDGRPLDGQWQSAQRVGVQLPGRYGRWCSARLLSAPMGGSAEDRLRSGATAQGVGSRPCRRRSALPEWPGVEFCFSAGRCRIRARLRAGVQRRARRVARGKRSLCSDGDHSLYERDRRRRWRSRTLRQTRPPRCRHAGGAGVYEKRFKAHERSILGAALGVL